MGSLGTIAFRRGVRGVKYSIGINASMALLDEVIQPSRGSGLLRCFAPRNDEEGAAGPSSYAASAFTPLTSRPPSPALTRTV